jgi:hemolysin D
MRAQAAEQLAKLASITRQIEQKHAETQSITATIAKIDASLPLVEEGASIRRKAMEIQYGNHIAWLDAQTKLVEQQNERIVQEKKLVEIAAARQALEQQIEQTRAAYEHQILNDLSDAENRRADPALADRRHRAATGDPHRGRRGDAGATIAGCGAGRQPARGRSDDFQP